MHTQPVERGEMVIAQTSDKNAQIQLLQREQAMLKEAYSKRDYDKLKQQASDLQNNLAIHKQMLHTLMSGLSDQEAATAIEGLISLNLKDSESRIDQLRLERDSI